MAEKFTFDADLVRQLAELLNETDLNEIEYEVNDHRIRVVRHRQEVVVPTPSLAAVTAAKSASAPEPVADVDGFSVHPGALKSPMVGNVYVSPEPEAPAFVSEGDTVTQGQTLFIIEAMKVMNPIKAPKSGKIKKIFVENAQPVEFDEVLLIIE